MTDPTPQAGLRIEDVKEGDALPELDVELTAAIIVGGALASRDYTPVHHDAAAARQAGMSDVFMNILTTNGYVGRFVTDWAGPDSSLRRVSIKLGAPNTPGDTLKLRGEVKAVDAGGGTAIVHVVAKNSWGEHASGEVVVALPHAS